MKWLDKIFDITAKVSSEIKNGEESNSDTYKNQDNYLDKEHPILKI